MYTTRIYRRSLARSFRLQRPQETYVSYKLGVLETQWRNEAMADSDTKASTKEYKASDIIPFPS